MSLSLLLFLGQQLAMLGSQLLQLPLGILLLSDKPLIIRRSCAGDGVGPGGGGPPSALLSR